MTVRIVTQNTTLLIKTLSGGSGLPPVTGHDGYAIIEVDSVAAFRPILESYIVPAFGITGFSAAQSAVEIGATVATPSFSASYNRTPDVATLNDDEGTPEKDVSSTPTSFSSAGTFQKTSNNDSVQFTLYAEETAGGPSDTRNATISWRPRTYWGVGVDGLSSESDIKALANNALDNNRQRTFTESPGAGEHIYYAYPESYGAATFIVEGFEGGFELVSDSIALTLNGVTQNYRLYKSTNPNLGTTTVEVQ